MEASEKKQKIAVVAGGSGYVGSAVVRQLAADGLRVVVLHRAASTDSVAVLLASVGEGHRAYPCELEDALQVHRTIRTIEEECGTISIGVYAAGALGPRKPLHLSTAEDLEEAFRKNALSGFNFLCALALRLKEHQNGVLIGITTAAVVYPASARGLGAYVPAKYALQGILATLREELLPAGIRVYSVAPGFMAGGLNSTLPKAFVEIARSSSPTKTLASATDVAARVSFLVSDAGADVGDLTVLIAPELGNP